MGHTMASPRMRHVMHWVGTHPTQTMSGLAGATATRVRTPSPACAGMEDGRENKAYFLY
jgi:hypothetical protein